MKRYLLLMACLGCQSIDSGGPSKADSSTGGSAATVSGKPDARQAVTPPDLADEAQYPAAVDGEKHALPTIQMVADLTSSFGETPITVSLDSRGEAVDESLLEALADQVQLIGPDGREVPSTKTVTNASVEAPARVTVVPDAPLQDAWHTLKVKTTPAGLAWPTFSASKAFPDGSHGSRFAPGSHPTPSAVRVCHKQSGNATVIVDWSERVAYPEDAESIAHAKEISGVPADCVADPALAGSGSTPSLRFICSSLPAKGAVMSLALHQRIASPSGRVAEMRGVIERGERLTQVRADEMTRWGDDCQIARPW